MRKAQSISINTIIVAAIALIVLILIVMIFTGNITNWRQSAGSCGSNGGVCVRDDIDVGPDGTYYRFCEEGAYVRVRHDLSCYRDGKPADDLICCVRT